MTVSMDLIGLGLIFAMACMQTVRAEEEVVGDVEFPGEWTVFAPFGSYRSEVSDLPPSDVLRTIPGELDLGGTTLPAQVVLSTNNQFNFQAFLGEPPRGWDRGAYVFVPLESSVAQEVTLGMGADYKLQAWLNGELIMDTTELRHLRWPPAINDHQVNVPLQAGKNILAVRFVSGKASSLLALGGPRELRAGDFWSIAPDPFDPSKQSAAYPPAHPGDKPAVDIGSRLELFVDDFLLDGMSGGVMRRMHHPVPREVILTLDKPWEGNTSAYLAVIQHEGRVLLYFNATPHPRGQTTGVIESHDGIHFTRPVFNLYDFQGSKENNLLPRMGASGHNFTPFLDANPAVPPDQRYKAIAYHPNGGGLGAYASADGINWRMLVEERVIGQPGGFDSQNLAFWDGETQQYVCYYRHEDPRGRLRGIWRQVSTDFIHWSDPQPVTYADDRMEHMYTNVIRPYFRAPHIYIGLPARYVPTRRKIMEHQETGISDGVLMSSRDGLRFQRWKDAFIRPDTEPEVWTDRNNYPAWGMVQTASDEISLYWTEHYRHPGMRLRRGTIRTDGFVSLYAGEQPGEVLTRPLIFSGNRLVVNYATAAVGLLQIEICDEQGAPIKNYALADCEVLFGNEIEHVMTWKRKSDIGHLAGKPVRLRIRLDAADLYSLRFME